MPLGIFYVNPAKTTFEENTGVYRQDEPALHKRELNIDKLRNLVEDFKTPH
jgi:2-oxoglutarate ferredoxin oxidoreductase subunit beta